MASRRRKYTRRALLAAGALAVGCTAVGAGGYVAVRVANKPINNIGDVEFASTLAIPPLLDPEPSEDGRKHYDLTLQTGSSQLVPEGEAKTWGVNGPYLAPTLRARRGDDVAVTLRNELPEATTIHWHGMHLPALMDGGPHQMIPTGKTWQPEWTVDQPAATLWYHPHPHGDTAAHVYRGIAGMFLLDDEESAGLSLPKEYGVDDIPLIIQDKRFDAAGNITIDVGGFIEDLFGSSNFGVLGDTILVNGTYGPVFAPARTLTRFRILNASNARFYNLGFTDDRRFRLIATDNGLLPGEPVELTRLLVGPGERAEIVVAFDAGEEITLRSYPQDLGDSENLLGSDDTFDILRMRATRSLDASPPVPSELGAGLPAPDVPDNATLRDIELQGHNRINDEEMDMGRIDLVIPARAVEVWRVSSSGQPHTFHIHGCSFHVLDIGGEAPLPQGRGSKDTVFIHPDRSVTLAVQFDGYVDPATPYMYHCHILRHEDNGMMGQFVVVEPETVRSVTTTIGAPHH